MKHQKYHTVGTVPKSDRKTKNTTLSEQFQNPREKSRKEATSIPIIHKCMTVSLKGPGTGTSIKSGGIKLVLLDQTL
jgi:hypothetical protein